jgi:hypothetical protein
MVRIALLGIEILRVDWSGADGQGGDLEGYELVEDEDEDEDVWDGRQQLGAHIERDHAPLTPEQRYEYWDEDRRRFGFG